MAVLSLRVVTVEPLVSRQPLAALDATRSGFRGATATTAPVLRIFGSTPAGQKACVHLHGVFPYVLVPYDDCGQEFPDPFLRQFAFSIDRALNVALGNPSSSEQHVFKISLVSGRPFYGFHEKERLFMKIYLYNPRMMKRVAELLLGGAVMNKSFQPHDAHIPYVLQFFIDYNIYGMNLLKLAAVKFRRGSALDKRGEVEASGPESRPVDVNVTLNSESMDTQTALMRWWDADSIPSSLWLGEEVTRQSRCELELDAVAADILNRLNIEVQVGQNPGLQAIWEDERQRRRDAGSSSQIGLPASQARLIEDDGQKEFVKQILDILQRNSSHEGTSSACAEYTPGETSVNPSPVTGLEVTSDNGEMSASGESNCDDAVINDDAIRSVVESSQLFSPRCSQSRHSQPLDNSGDESMAHLLAGLEADFDADEETPAQTLSGDAKSIRETMACFDEAVEGNDDEEEELSFVMTQPWDTVSQSEVDCDTLKNSREEQQGNESPDPSDTQGTGWESQVQRAPEKGIAGGERIASSPSLFGSSGQSATTLDRHLASVTSVSYSPDRSQKAKDTEAVASGDSVPSGSYGIDILSKNPDEISHSSALVASRGSSTNAEGILREGDNLNKQKRARDEADGCDVNERRKRGKRTRASLDTESRSRATRTSLRIAHRGRLAPINDSAINDNFDHKRFKGDRKMVVKISNFKPCQSLSFPSHLKFSDVKNQDAIWLPDRTSKLFCSLPENIIRSVNDATKMASGETGQVKNTGFPSYYNSCINDHECEYSDVMAKLSYWSQHSSAEDGTSPPQCWSPSDSTNECVSVASNLPAQAQDGFLVEPSLPINLLNTSEVNEKRDGLSRSDEIRGTELAKDTGASLSVDALDRDEPPADTAPDSTRDAECPGRDAARDTLADNCARAAGSQAPAASSTTAASASGPGTRSSPRILLNDLGVTVKPQHSLPSFVSQEKACHSEASPARAMAPSRESGRVVTDPVRPSWAPTSLRKVMAKPLMLSPKYSSVLATLTKYNLPGTTYQDAYCSDPADIPAKDREVGERILKVGSKHGAELRECDGKFAAQGLTHWRGVCSAVEQTEGRGVSLLNPGESQTCALEIRDRQDYSRAGKAVGRQSIVVVSPCKVPPSRQRVHRWLKARHRCEKAKANLAGAALPRIFGTSETASEPRASQGEGRGTAAVVCDETLAVGDKPDESTVLFPSTKSEMLEAELRPAGFEFQTAELKEYAAENAGITLEMSQVKALSGDVAQRSCGKHTAEPSENPSYQEPVDLRTESRHVEVSGMPSSFIHSTPVALRGSGKNMILAAVSPVPTACASESADTVVKDTPKRPGTLRRMVFNPQLKRRMFSSGEKDTSQIEGPTLNNSYGFKISQQDLNNAKSLHEVQHLTLMSVEMHARTRGHLFPDPNLDPVCCLFFHIVGDAPLPGRDSNEATGVIVNDATGSKDADLQARWGVSGLDVIHVSEEDQLFHELEQVVHRFDPDILIGYEVEMLSWGYLLQRAATKNRDFKNTISRIMEPREAYVGFGKNEGDDDFPDIHIGGRVVLNLWNQMRAEVTLNVYSFENVAYHVLHQRYPFFNFRTLSDWFDNKAGSFRWKTVEYYVCRVVGNIKLLHQLDVIGRTSELARLFGILFHEVLSRGSQFRVESVMLRVAKPLNYIAVSPSPQQRAAMSATECLPMVLEPESRFYSNPVLVLDFQSLYPSVVIAYNYCYSTCLGRVEHLGTNNEFKFGCTTLRVPPDLLSSLRNKLTICPNGVAFVKASVRKGVLPRMLDEILQTRIMVKHCMKEYGSDRALTRLLHARQLGLKLIANVTFGYTDANYSGRMPCVEVGDSILRKSRETLERAIKQVNETKEWGARVVYGDTDSMFVLLEGATKEQAFRTGKEIAAAVTAANPSPIKLKFEKVYLPCVLQTKKRYVGYMYESLEQKEPVYDAKGIETVRRDGCPAVAKILERSLKLLFEEKDISRVKQYVQRQCLKILEGRASMQDLIFAKEYRGRSAYKPGACVPALHLARKMYASDRRSEPRAGERVPYVIVHGAPGLPLIRLVRRPHELLHDPSLLINGPYYVSKQVLPPLDRMLSLVGVDVFSWYQQLPRSVRVWAAHHQTAEGRKATIAQYFSTVNCPMCGDVTKEGICGQCRRQPQAVAVSLLQRIHSQERRQAQLLQICRSCTGHAEWKPPCSSIDCSTLFRLLATEKGLCQAPYIRGLIDLF